MRLPRIKVPGHAAAYHVVTRANGRQFKLGPELKQYFIDLLRKLKGLYYIEYAAFTVLDNHYHLIARMSDPKDIRHEEAIKRWNTYHAGTIYCKNAAEEKHRTQVVEELTDISSFMKRLNYHVSVRHNQIAETEGTIWEQRFRSSIVERGYALVHCAAYIELNAFRASLVRKPEEYAFGQGRIVTVPK
ncbi:MAG: transposase [Planctomycetota bacterium]